MPDADPSELAPTTRGPTILVSVVALFTGWALWLLASPDHPFFLLFDDSFYYLEIARNIVHGRGSTFDGIHPTNGYHPLWMALCTVPFALGLDGLHAARAVLVAQLVATGAATYAVLRTAPALPAGPRWLTWGGGLLFAANAWFLKCVANGMESALVFVLHAAILLMAARRSSRLAELGGRRSRLALGALLALAFLARTDGGLLAAAAIAGLAWQARGRGWAASAAVAAEVGVLPAVALVAFLVANLAWFGHPMQVSGELKRVTPGALGGIVVLAGLGVAAWRLLAPRRTPGPLAGRLWATRWYQAFLALHLAWYLGFQSFPRQWYFAPEALFALWLVPGALAALAERAAADAGDRTPARAAALATGPLLGALAAGAALSLAQALSPGLLPARLADRAAAEWADAHLPADSVLSSWDAGVIGYFCALPVVNLDGVVNSFEFLDAMRDGTTADLLARAGVTHAINHHAIGPDGEPTELREAIGRRFGPDAAAAAVVVQTFPFTMEGASNRASRGSHAMATTILALP